MEALSCVTSPDLPRPNRQTRYPWVNLFQLLDVHGVSWKYYLGKGNEPDCEHDEMTCAPKVQRSDLPSAWNVAPSFGYVQDKGKSYLHAHVPEVAQFLADVRTGQLPSVAWIVPADAYSEHPPNPITTGMEYVTSLVNAVMESPYWTSTAIFISWDDWGGFYDHEMPPYVDSNQTATPVQGYGLRVPGLMISPWARQGMIDHAIYSLDAYAALIETLFLGGARLVPYELGNPDRRPTIRDALRTARLFDGTIAQIGNLLDEFDFTQTQSPPLILSTTIPTGISASCGQNPSTQQCQSTRVALSWNPVVQAADSSYSYEITRDGQVLPQCRGRLTSCTDVPGHGWHYYRAISVDALKKASPLSAAALAMMP